MIEDGKILRLEYISNDLACIGKYRRSDNLRTRIIIYFECGNFVGGLVYIFRFENKNIFIINDDFNND